MAGNVGISQTQSIRNGNGYVSALIVLTSLFFMWGFITCMNDILIPFLKKAFELDRLQSMLVQFSFFTAYFIGALLYFIISARAGDPINKIGYKNGILAGLFISALGCLLFYPAAHFRIFGLFLGALFVLALGFTLLQIAANPYVAILGKAESASARLNLSQGFNSFGTAIAPILGGYLVFHYFARWGKPLLNSSGQPILTDIGEPISAQGVQLPYLIFGGIFLLLMLLIGFSKLPAMENTEEIEPGAGALKYRHLVLGIIAIFMYVGGEVTIGSALINYMNESVGFPEMEAKSFLAFYWGGAMIGRFLGAISLSTIPGDLKKFSYMLAVAVVSFFVLYLFVYLESVESGIMFPLKRVVPFLLFIALNLGAFLLGRSLPGRTLMIFSFVAILLLGINLTTTGMTAVWAVLGIGLFNSIMWSNIFTLAIRDLGKYTSQGSSLLIMAILGGALIPVIQGAVADSLGGYHYSFFVPIFSYIYLAYFGWKGHIVKKFE
ncbi:MAG TPA: sugar MFS transporter [Cyclobacteriaceae bacterium]|nr:sugar MFS transporter [Cyclobacteriaceae bacterium]